MSSYVIFRCDWLIKPQNLCLLSVKPSQSNFDLRSPDCYSVRSYLITTVKFNISKEGASYWFNTKLYKMSKNDSQYVFYLWMHPCLVAISSELIYNEIQYWCSMHEGCSSTNWPKLFWSCIWNSIFYRFQKMFFFKMHIMWNLFLTEILFLAFSERIWLHFGKMQQAS